MEPNDSPFAIARRGRASDMKVCGSVCLWRRLHASEYSSLSVCSVYSPQQMAKGLGAASQRAGGSCRGSPAALGPRFGDRLSFGSVPETLACPA